MDQEGSIMVVVLINFEANFKSFCENSLRASTFYNTSENKQLMWKEGNRGYLGGNNVRLYICKLLHYRRYNIYTLLVFTAGNFIEGHFRVGPKAQVWPSLKDSTQTVVWRKLKSYTGVQLLTLIEAAVPGNNLRRHNRLTP